MNFDKPVLLLEAVSDIVLAKVLVALGSGHDDGERAFEKGVAGVQRARCGQAAGMRRARHTRRPARQEAGARRLHRQQRR